jgi:hypothetical protein
VRRRRRFCDRRRAVRGALRCRWYHHRSNYSPEAGGKSNPPATPAAFRKNGYGHGKKWLVIDNPAVARFLFAGEALFAMLPPLAIMRSFSARIESRREFFRTAARAGLLALLTAAAGLAARPRTPAGQRCVNRGLCRGCAVFGSCGLPQALSARGAQAGG